ncbi:tonB dependent receptor family protein [Asticcacaulis biprosthecium C19]|uniref:TonB dependent receptor family protein n=1 Tax=Asticcacaulis biprosthecium C19 TaxID=715226 RepID=F4QIM9_9CAUL|nr:TonB-dependent receptor [Asticcacaulis biprosthecium]EGF91788.1 tonB dependent receptor family protein [Asticcacaulis biprosthecium C19]
MNKRILSATLLTTTMLTAMPVILHAQDAAAPVADSGEIIVTAQKRSERLSSVPIAITALTTKKLDQLNIGNFNDYALQLPSVSFQTSQPGSTNVYMRGVASGGDGNHSGSLPSVGVYLDEQPVTTIGGALDVHIYDVSRIESLAGPQGTLYGASSQAGTIRIITNKPDLSGFYGRFDAEANTISGGENGGKLEGMLNIPLSTGVALRVVGWTEKVGGYIDNVPGTRAFLPDVEGIVVDNDAFVEEDFNDLSISGARAALKIDFSEDWTATASLMGQTQKATGIFGFDESVGDMQVQRFYPDNSKDRFAQAALTVEGKIGNFDVTYATAYMDRKSSSTSDYTDYATAYDEIYTDYGGLAGYFYLYDSNGDTVDPRQYITGSYDYGKTSHELRIASPQDGKFRWVGGLFYQEQTNHIYQNYIIPNLAPEVSVNGWPETLWLTLQDREDKDTAIFGEATYDFTPTLSLTAGLRLYEYENSLIGFYGFGRNPNGKPWNGAGSSGTGVAGCYTSNGKTVRQNYDSNTTANLLPGVVPGTPCTNLGEFDNGTVVPKIAQGDGSTYRLNLSYKPKAGRLYYATLSTGFRPGGINRRGDYDYLPDYLTNLEGGWKVTLADGTLRWSGAVYHQKWEDFQFSFLGENSFTQIRNGADATINGVEMDVTWSPTSKLTLTGSAAYTDATIDGPLCPTVADSCPGAELAPAGTRLPITPEFKVAGSARYTWTEMEQRPFVQGVFAHQTGASSDLRVADAAVVGDLPAYTTINLSSGFEWSTWTMEAYVSNLTDERGQMSRYVACSVCTRPYAVIIQPRTFGIRVGSKF